MGPSSGAQAFGKRASNVSSASARKSVRSVHRLTADLARHDNSSRLWLTAAYDEQLLAVSLLTVGPNQRVSSDHFWLRAT